MNFLEKTGYFLLRGVCLILGALPYLVLYYPLRWVVYFFTYKVARYRLNIVRENLKRAFPDYSDKQRLEIERKFYHNLAETMIDVIDISGLTPRQVAKRIAVKDLEEHKKNTEGKNWISAMAHFGSWEYTSTYCFFDDTHDLAAIYKPLTNKVFDKYFKTFRTQYKATVVPMADIIRFVVSKTRQKEGKNIVIAMIADQRPNRKAMPSIIPFFDYDTKFFNGVEKMALKFKMQVYFLNIEKTSRAHYTFQFEMIYDGEEQVQEHEITRRYAEKLEQMIRRCPELWLWSHRRWRGIPLKGSSKNSPK